PPRRAARAHAPAAGRVRREPAEGTRMIDKLIEGKLVTLLVGGLFRAVEIFVRTIHLTVRGIRLLVQETITSRIDARLSRIGKRRVARAARVDAGSVVVIEPDGEYTGDAKYVAEE